VNWEAVWTVKQGAGGNGFATLVKAQKVLNTGAGDELLIKGKSAVVRGTDLVDDADAKPVLTGNVITLSLGTYTSGITRIGTTGSVNFNLKYIPFNLAGGAANPWNAFDGKSAFDLREGNTPVWIIRNGVNDLAQDGDTDFNSFHNIGNPAAGTANGNGAASFVVAAGSPEAGALVIKDGVFVGPAGSIDPYIKYTTEGYAGDAEVYCAVVPAGETPAYSAYTRNLGSVPAGNYGAYVTLPSAGGNYDVYVL
jgi:hypothetical protein